LKESVQKEKNSFLRRLLPHLMLLSASFFWGLNPMLMKVGFRELSPLGFNTLRLAFGVFLMLPLVLAPGNWKRIRRQDLPGFFVVAVPGFFVFQLFYSFGVDLTSASISSIIIGMLPIMVALISMVFRIEGLQKRKILGIILTFSGVSLIAVGKNSGLNLEQTYLLGIVLVAISELGYGVYTVFIKPLTNSYPSAQIVMISMAVSLLLCATVALPLEGVDGYFSLSPLTWVVTFLSGVFALVVGNILWSYGIRHIGSTNASVYGNLTPVFGVLAGIIVLGESLNLLQSMGAIIVMSGVILVNSRFFRGKKSTPGDPSRKASADSASSRHGNRRGNRV
jgi:drug/metabolite transporter (DMT)-like permease